MSKTSELNLRLEQAQNEIKRLNEIINLKNDTLAKIQNENNGLKAILSEQTGKTDDNYKAFREIALNLSMVVRNSADL